jgi:hypothetical protein
MVAEDWKGGKMDPAFARKSKLSDGESIGLKS